MPANPNASVRSTKPGCDNMADSTSAHTATARQPSPSTITLMVCKGFSGEIVRAEIDPNEIVERAIPMIADQIGYVSYNWEKIGLYNLTLDYEYRMDDRFSDCNTESGDLLMMADGEACHK